MRARTFSRHGEPINLCIDGVVLAMPPAEEVARWNHCIEGEHFIWRKPGETALPELAGANDYPNQVTIDRAVPFWAAFFLVVAAP